MSDYRPHDNHSRVKKKKIFAVALFALIIFCIFSTISAYYSDFLNSSVLLSSSTLDIDGDYSVFLNGQLTQVDNIASLNPGDVIVVKATITNQGNQCAWIREKIDLSTADAALLPNLKVFAGEFSAAQLIDDPVSAAQNQLAIVDGIAVGSNKVIDGGGDNAEIVRDGEYNFVLSNVYQLEITIFFLPSAGNETQNKVFSLGVTTQALQFKNNNASQPDESAWATVSQVG